MTGILPRICSSACQADSTCVRLPCFQARLDAAPGSGQSRIHKHAEACANHLGAIVVAMATWAHEQALTNVDLTVLAIEPPPRGGYLWRESRDYEPTSALVFSIIHLGEPEVTLADVGPSIWAPADLGYEVRSARSLQLSASATSCRERQTEPNGKYWCSLVPT